MKYIYHALVIFYLMPHNSINCITFFTDTMITDESPTRKHLTSCIGVVVRMSILDTKVAGSNLSINMFSP